MQAIIELFAAILEGLVHALVGLLTALIHLISLAVQFLFIAVTQGIVAAKEQNRRTRERYATVRESRRSQSTGEESSSPTGHSSGLPVWVYVIVVGGVLVVGIGMYISGRIQAARIEATKELVKQQANEIADAIAQGNPTPDRGKLPIEDPWRQPLELFMDETALGTLVVVRSNGPDRRSGTSDDLLGIRMQQKPLKQLGGEIGNVAVEKLKEKAAALLRRQADGNARNENE
jgi:hypothetical protein